MFGTIVVPLDGSRGAELAIPYAAEEAARHDCALVLLHVISRPELAPRRVAHGGPAPRPFDWPRAELASAADDASAYLRDVIRRHGLPLDTEFVIPIGDPFARLEAEIERRPRPLVVLAAEAADEPRSHLLDETARRLLVDGVAPVLRVQPPSLASTSTGQEPSTRIAQEVPPVPTAPASFF
jgi:nucleotide-binding universal stress UspA family protein